MIDLPCGNSAPRIQTIHNAIVNGGLVQREILRTMAACFTSSFIISTASGQVPNGVNIMADIDCGKWAKARQEKRAQYLENYLTGFVDGLALGRFVEIWVARGAKVNPAQVHLWMDKYCAANPLESVISGATQLANERTEGEFGRLLRTK